jgi:hypothetical protein
MSRFSGPKLINNDCKTLDAIDWNKGVNLGVGLACEPIEITHHQQKQNKTKRRKNTKRGAQQVL